MFFMRNYRYLLVKKWFVIWVVLFSVSMLVMLVIVFVSNEREFFIIDFECYFKLEDIFNLEYVSEV